MEAIEEAPPLQDQTTLLHDEEESFALAPVDASALKGLSYYNIILFQLFQNLYNYYKYNFI